MERRLRRERPGLGADAGGETRSAGIWSDLLVALAAFLFIVSFSVVLVLNIRQIYDYEIHAQHLSEDVMLTEEQIRENYDVLIDYNLFWKGVDVLEFPDFPMSERGRIHFEEVKRIFVGIQYLMIGSAVVFFAGLRLKLRRRACRCLKLASVFTLLIPAALGMLVSLNWEWFFVTFHHVMFSNDYWLFDPVTDPVIWILPDAFFLHCALAILGCMAAMSAVLGIAYRILTRKRV